VTASFVLDASVTMSWLLGDANAESSRYAASVLEALRHPDVRARVPGIWALEIANVLARAEARNLLTEAQSNAFLEMLAHAGIDSEDGTFARALTDALHLARRYGLSSYDASYLELALRTGLPLATLDTDLARAAARAGVDRFSA
jgi:predicted nucleic acid-binding protein